MNTANTLGQPRRSVDVFLPIVLIGAGVIFLMANLGLITQDPFAFLFQFWPLFLIVAGIQIIFARTGVIGTLVSAALALVVVVSAILYLTLPGERFAPPWFSWNWNWLPRDAQLRTETVTKPFEDVRALSADLHLPAGRGSIRPVTNAANLLEGDLTYLGVLTTNVTREGDTASVLINSEYQQSGLNLGSGGQRWDIRLNPRATLDLNLDVGSGAYEFDLREFDVKSVRLDQGSGGTTFRLPEKGQYRFRIDAGSGSVNVILPKGLPARVTYDIGSGWLNVGETYRVVGSNQRGTYETEGFTQNGAYVIFDVELGSGLVTIR